MLKIILTSANMIDFSVWRKSYSKCSHCIEIELLILCFHYKKKLNPQSDDCRLYIGFLSVSFIFQIYVKYYYIRKLLPFLMKQSYFTSVFAFPIFLGTIRHFIHDLVIAVEIFEQNSSKYYNPCFIFIKKKYSLIQLKSYCRTKHEWYSELERLHIEWMCQFVWNCACQKKYLQIL